MKPFFPHFFPHFFFFFGPSDGNPRRAFFWEGEFWTSFFFFFPLANLGYPTQVPHPREKEGGKKLREIFLGPFPPPFLPMRSPIARPQTGQNEKYQYIRIFFFLSLKPNSNLNLNPFPEGDFSWACLEYFSFFPPLKTQISFFFLFQNLYQYIYIYIYNPKSQQVCHNPKGCCQHGRKTWR